LAKISIHDLKLSVSIGVTKEERAFPQELTLDVSIDAQTEQAEQSDAIGDTLDYMAVIQGLEELCRNEQWCLLEHFGAELCNQVLEMSPIVHRVSIRMLKRVHSATSGVSVLVERTRG
jgi:FolB domain-containing protein